MDPAFSTLWSGLYRPPALRDEVLMGDIGSDRSLQNPGRHCCLFAHLISLTMAAGIKFARSRL